MAINDMKGIVNHPSGLNLNQDQRSELSTDIRKLIGGYHFLGDSDGKMFNGPICILAKVLKHVTASAAETELGAIHSNAREGTIFRQTLEELGHHQAATPIKTDNATARGILDESMKARHLKGADMRLHWMKDRVENKTCDVCWC